MAAATVNDCISRLTCIRPLAEVEEIRAVRLPSCQ
jgi:hypothetical protein